MRRVRRIRVMRSRGRRRVASDSGQGGAQSVTPKSPALYVAVPGDGQNAPSVVKADASQARRRPLLPVHEVFRSSVEVGVLGRPRFREWLCAILERTTMVNLAFDREGPVTADLVAELSTTGVVLVDGESGRQMALRAPVRNPNDALARVNVLLIADPADFKPPHQVAAVIGSHWSLLLATSAENPLRLGRAIRKAAEGRSTIDAGIDPKMVRIADDLSVRRKT